MAIEYKQIKEAPDYWIANNGTVLSRRVEGKELEIKQHTNPKTGYRQLALCIGDKNTKARKTFYPHRLVAEYFVENPSGYNTVNHKDLDKTNNHSFNLEWTTQSENIRHYYLSNAKGKPREMKAVEQWSISGEYIATFPSVSNASKETGVNVASVFHCCKGKIKKPKHFFFKYVDNE
jgi:hypothetical protein